MNVKNLFADAFFKELLIENKIKNSKIIAFHGSPFVFENFRDEFVGSEEAEDAEGVGIYFTESEEEAHQYSEGEGGVVYKVELFPRLLYDNTENKFTITTNVIKKLVTMAHDWKRTAENIDYPYSKGISVFIDILFEYNDNDKDILLEIYKNFYRYEPIDFVRNCVKLGIDGIKIKNEKYIHYVIYNPNIIKILDLKKKI